MGVHKDRERFRAAFDMEGERRYRSLRSREFDAAVVEARYAEVYGIDYAGSPPPLADLVERFVAGLSVTDATRERHWREAGRMEELGMTVAALCPTGLDSFIERRAAAEATMRAIRDELTLMRRAARPLAEVGICDMGCIEERIGSLEVSAPRRAPLDAAEVADLLRRLKGPIALGCLLALEGDLTAKEMCAVRPEMVDGTTLHLLKRDVRLDERLARSVAEACEEGCYIMSGTGAPMNPRRAAARATKLLRVWRVDATLRDLVRAEGSSEHERTPA